MARTSPRKSACATQTLWRRLLEDPQALEDLDATGLEQAWAALCWASENEKLEPLAQPVSADTSATSTSTRVALHLMSTPPAGVGTAERLRVVEWTAALHYPPLELMRAQLLAQSGRVKEAIAVFESLKSTTHAFPEVPFVAGRTLLAVAGSDSKLLHKAETWLLHAEHLTMDGSDEAEDEDACDADPECAPPEIVLDESAQRRLAEIWELMATLYARLGDPKKSEMYRMRAGSAAEETEEATPDGLEPFEGELPDRTVLKPADRSLIRRFLDSPQACALSPTQRQQAASAMPSFVSLGRMFLGLAPARLDRYSLEELMLGLVPEKLVATLDEIANLPAVLTAWIHFLGKGGYLRDGARLVALVARLSGEMVANCQNPDVWSMSKTLAMRMLASGVDLDDAEAVRRYLEGRSARLLAV